MIYGIPIEVIIGVGAGLAAGGIAYALSPRPETRKTASGLVGTGTGFLAAGVAWFLRTFVLK